MNTIRRARPTLNANYTGVEGAYRALLAKMRYEDEAHKREYSAFRDLGPVVYYVWRAPYIKIGHSTELRHRLSALGVDRRQLLAIEPGSMADEAAAHARFNDSRAFGEDLGREHFWPSEHLVAHINELRVKYGVRPVTVKLVAA